MLQPTLCSLALLSLSGLALGQATAAYRTWEGRGGNFGSAVSGAGDVNGDGVDDVIVGAFEKYIGGDPNVGRAYVYSGATGGLLYGWRGEAIFSDFGSSVAGAGDVNGDGFGDVIVGASRNDGPSGSNSGKAYVYSGATGGLLYSWDGEAVDDQLGYSVSGVGDVNSDGFDDVAVGVASYDGHAGRDVGRVYVYSGATGGLLYSWDGELAYAIFSTVSSAGDVNGDGVGDVVVGARGHHGPAGKNSGKAYVFSGATGGVLYSWEGEAAVDLFGRSVSGAGDVNGDGFGDVIVGATRHDGPPGSDIGKAYVYSGATGDLLYSWIGEAPSANFGFSVSGAGDMNGDGFGDVVVGAWFQVGPAGSNQGKAYVYSGATGGLLYSWIGEAAVNIFGESVSDAGDMNGDGFSDVVVGARYFSTRTITYAGKVYVYLGGAEDQACPAELVGDPVLADSAGTLNMGPRIASTSQPFNLSIDCSSAGAAGIYSIELRPAKLAPPVTSKFGWLYLAGPNLISAAGAHSIDVQGFSATDVVLPLDPALVGFTYHAQGWCSGYATGVRASSALSQTIGG